MVFRHCHLSITTGRLALTDLMDHHLSKGNVRLNSLHQSGYGRTIKLRLHNSSRRHNMGFSLLIHHRNNIISTLCELLSMVLYHRLTTKSLLRHVHRITR